MAPVVYGTHLTLRLGEVERSDVLDSPHQLGAFLEQLVAGIGMRLIAGPVVATEAGDDDHYGHSAVAILAESHAAVHTYPRRSQLFLDVFSCRPFEPETVLTVCDGILGTCTVMESAVFERGYHWGRDAEKELQHWRLER